MVRPRTLRQRVLLAVIGLVLIAGALVATGIHLGWRLAGLDGRWRQDRVFPPSADTDLTAGVVLAVGILLVLLAVWLVIGSIPRRPGVPTLRWTEQNSLTQMSGDVLSRQLEQQALAVAGVEEAEFRLTGAASDPGLIGRITIAPTASLPAVQQGLSDACLAPAERMIGQQLTDVAVLYRVSAVASGSSVSQVNLNALSTRDARNELETG